MVGLLFNCSSDSSDDLTPTPDPDPIAKVTYVGNVKAIIDGNCTTCHGTTPTNGAPPSSSFTNYNEVKNRVDAIISRTNNASNPMPPTGLMSQNLRDIIQQWKTDGLLEN